MPPRKLQKDSSRQPSKANFKITKEKTQEAITPAKEEEEPDYQQMIDEIIQESQEKINQFIQARQENLVSQIVQADNALAQQARQAQKKNSL